MNLNNSSSKPQMRPSGCARATRIVGATIILPILLFLLTGCWDRTEINDIGFVLATSIDREGDHFVLGVQIALPGQLGGASGGGGGTSGSKPYYIDSEKAPTVGQAIGRLQSRMARKMFFAHRRVIVIGESLAKEEKIPIQNILFRSPENRLTSHLIVAKGTALDLIKAQPQLERFSSATIRDIAISKNSIHINLKDLAVATYRTNGDNLAYLMEVKTSSDSKGEESQEIQMLGYALFKNGKMIDSFEEDAAAGLPWLVNRKNQVLSLYTIGEENQFVSILVDQGTSRIRPVIRAGRVHFDISIQAQAAIEEKEHMLNLTSEKVISDLEQKLGEQMKRSIMKAIDTFQKHGSDPVLLGVTFERAYPELWQQKYSNNWGEHLRQATFNVTVRPNISRIGPFSENKHIREARQ